MDFKLNKNNLNFRVYTATETPATGVENDIAFITETPMKNWIMSPDAPRGIPRCDGDVWLQYSVDGDLTNILRTNALLVSVHSAYQYVNGAWVDVAVIGYQDGEWSTRWNGVLYDSGNEHETVTGGWIGLKMQWSSAFSESEAVTPTISRGADKISATISPTSSGYASGILCVNNDIELTDKTEIVATAKISQSDTTTFGYLMVFNRAAQYIQDCIAYVELPTTLTEVKLSLSTAGLSGKYAVGFGFRLKGTTSVTVECVEVKVI